MQVREIAGIVPGALVQWNEKIGVVEALSGNRADVRFDSGEAQTFTTQSKVLKRYPFEIGSQVCRVTDQLVGVIVGTTPGDGYPTWKVSFPGASVNIAESGLRPAVIDDPVERMRSGQLGKAGDFNLRSVAADYWTAHHHNELVSLAHARVDLKPYQVSVVHRVISHYPHRFLLCDEVGLGKTIEAAMIVKELRARGQARRTLILTPSGLTRQWQFELKTKFNESFAIYDSTTLKYLKTKGAANPWTDHNSVITSHAWAAWTAERVAAIAEVDWDLIIVDEAHHARGRTQVFRLVEELVTRKEFGRRAVLFLTATPLQLHRSELYSLVQMLDPILFSSDEDFNEHIMSLSGLNKTVERLEGRLEMDDEEMFGVIHDVARFLDVAPNEAERLIEKVGPTALAQMLRDKHRLSEVLIRNRKSVVQGFQPRYATRWKVTLSPEEALIQKHMDAIFQEGFRLAEETNQHAIGFLMVILHKLLYSSSRALLVSLRRRKDKLQNALAQRLNVAEAEQELGDDAEAGDVVSHLAAETSAVEAFDEVIELLEGIDMDSKAQVLIEGLKNVFQSERDAKILIFTEFRETQAMLAEVLAPIATINLFHGQLGGEQKDASVNRFRTGVGPQILVSTEAGGEGRNFQFCHFVANYDLPWNPMKVEQRIGRVDRIGQEHPITIFNLYVEGTIEGRILDVLEKRIHIFEEAVGGLDPILGEAETDIRGALRLGHTERDVAIENIGRRLEREISDAKAAEEKLHDFIMQDKSFSAGIAQKAMQVQSPISQTEFEVFLEQLLRSANTYLYRPQENGERRIVFHAPFVLEHPELIEGQESRRVCFDPKLNVDSELVEYLGFGHPIVDALVRRATEERLEGTAAVRRVQGFDRGGWQFNYLVKIGGLRPSEFVFPVFVDDDGNVDEAAGEELLRHSRLFAPETIADGSQTETLDSALAGAEAAVVARRDRELEEAQIAGRDRADVEEGRLRAVMEHRTIAAKDRIAACAATLERFRGSGDEGQRRIMPLWEANLARAEAELQAIQDDFESSLIDLNKRRNPAGEFSLLNVALIWPGSSIADA
jgi:ATP-dependent helicase HepA